MKLKGKHRYRKDNKMKNQDIVNYYFLLLSDLQPKSFLNAIEFENNLCL